MVESYYAETFVKGKDNVLNFTRSKRIKDKFLLTTNHGAWVLVSKEEYDMIQKNDLDDGLFKTLEEKGIIITKRNMGFITRFTSQRLNYLYKGPSLHIIIPTLRCNHKCIYCHSSAKQKEDTNYDMDKETANKTLKFIFQTTANNITIEFQGGDTLLNQELFRYIVLKAKEMNKTYRKNIRFDLVTNLTLMDDKIVEFINKEQISVCTSLDGPKEVHDKNRVYEGNRPTYDDVVFWMEKLKKEHNKGVGALMVTTKYSLPYWKEIVDEYVKRGINSLQIKYINKLGFADHEWEKVGYTIEEFLNFWKKSMEYIIELNKKGINIQERYVKIILMKILNRKDPSFLDLRSPCGIVIGQLAYNYNGDVYSCDEGRNFEMFNLGNVKKENYKEILNKKKSQRLIKASINDNYLCDACVYKPYCGTCPVINYAEEGNILPKLATNSKCKYHKYVFDYVFEKLLFDKEVRKIFFNWIK